LSSCSIKTKARSDRRTSMSIAITSRTVRQLQPCATPQRPSSPFYLDVHRFSLPLVARFLTVKKSETPKVAFSGFRHEPPYMVTNRKGWAIILVGYVISTKAVPRNCKLCALFQTRKQLFNINISARNV